MEEKKEGKNKKIIIGVVLIIVVIVGGYYISKEIRRAQLKAELKDTISQINNTMNLTPNSNNGISNTTPTSNEVQDYINNSFVLENAVVEQFDSYKGKEWGLTKIQVKNNGEKTVTEFEVTVYFQDEAGNDIAEDSFWIGSVYLNNSLKPNYSWKQEDDRYYSFDNLTSNVNPARHKIQITDLKFE